MSKRIRKSVKRIARSRFVLEVLEDLLAAAVIGAATKFADSKAGRKAKRATKEAAEDAARAVNGKAETAKKKRRKPKAR